MSFLKVLFWLCSAMIFYTYAGYPIALYVLSRFRRLEIRKSRYEPRISVIMSAFNEEKFIEEKLINMLEVDYPADKMEILVGSDGGSDQTDQIISKFHDPRIKFFRFIRNLGKPHVLNGLVQEASGTIIVFTDARQRMQKDSIRHLVENFHDTSVGCVSGELYFEETRGSGVARGMDAYWKYEKFLRRKESDIGSMLGATGAIYAIRKRLFVPLPHEILVDDMFIPLAIIQKGYRAVFETAAKAFDHASEKAGQEMKRKVRTLAGNYQIFKLFPDLFVPFRSPVAWQFISHKFLRLMVPFFLILAFIFNGALVSDPFYRLLFILQCAFYGLALLEMALSSRISGARSIGYIPYMFCVLNYSALLAFFRFMRKEEKKGTWEKAYA